MSQVDIIMQPKGKRSRSRSSGRKAKRVAFNPARGVPSRARVNAKESHSVDVTLAQEFASTGVFTLLNGTIPGDGLQNRQGRKINMQRLQLRGQIYVNDIGAAPAFDYLRTMVVYDSQANAAVPAITDLLRDVDANGANTTNSLAGLNMSTSDRFKILLDEWQSVPIQLGVLAGAATAGPQFQDWQPTSFKRFINLKGMETRYNAGSAGTIADITTGALYLYTMGLNSSANQQFSLNFHARLRYTA